MSSQSHNPAASYQLGCELWGLGIPAERAPNYLEQADLPTVHFAQNRLEVEYNAWCDSAMDEDEEMKWPESLFKPVVHSIKPEDLRVTGIKQPETGWKVGMSKAVRVEHIPTGIAVECGHMRSQHMNRSEALLALQVLLDRYFAED